MKAIDSHAHLDMDKPGHPGAEEMLERAFSSDLDAVMAVAGATRPGDFARTIELATRHDRVFAIAGIHPHGADQADGEVLDKLRNALFHPRVFAVGEIGLDYYHKFGDRDSQIELFIRQLDLAQRLNLPVIIHNREAGGDVLEILKERIPDRGGILHCYSEDAAYAKRALELNLYISFAGNVTYRNARNLHETAKQIPLERILIESEAPFMVPAAYRGKRNKPSFLRETAAFVAELREIPEEELAETLFANSLRVFGIEM